MDLNTETLKYLENQKPIGMEPGSREYFYRRSYSLYIEILDRNKNEKGEIGYYDPDDFVLAVSFAFSWLARIPKIHESTGMNYPFTDAAFCSYFKEIDRGNTSVDEDRRIVSNLTEVLDHSVVATSKTLHFLAPEYFPMIDKKVTTNWNSLFPQYQMLKNPTIDSYLNYCQRMRTWSRNTKTNLRKLEFCLFSLNN